MPPRPRSPLLLLLDFDGTLTHTSTIPLLLSLSPSPSISISHLTTTYTTSLHSHTTNYHPPPPLRKTLSAEIAFLNSLIKVEKASIERLEKAGVWKGVSREGVEERARSSVRGGEVRLRRGWEGLVGEVQRRGKVGVVSVNWSRVFIGACLREGERMGREEEQEGKEKEKGGGDSDDDDDDEAGTGVEVEVGDIDIRANELLFDNEGKGTGMLDRYFASEDTGIWTSEGKARALRELIEKYTLEKGGGGGGGVKPWTIYIGDSSTDLGCLMSEDVDVGICVRDDEGEAETETGEQRGLREVVERVGVRCLHVGRWKERERWEGGRKCLWWARDFEEVRREILEK